MKDISEEYYWTLLTLLERIYDDCSPEQVEKDAKKLDELIELIREKKVGIIRYDEGGELRRKAESVPV